MNRHAKASSAGSTQRQGQQPRPLLPWSFRDAWRPRRRRREWCALSRPARSRGGRRHARCSAPPSCSPRAPLRLFAAECPNEVRRQEQGITALAMPECRAYEDVSPGNPRATPTVGPPASKSSPDGDAVALPHRITRRLGAERSGEVLPDAPGGRAAGQPRTVVPQAIPDSRGYNVRRQRVLLGRPDTRTSTKTMMSTFIPTNRAAITPKPTARPRRSPRPARSTAATATSSCHDAPPTPTNWSTSTRTKGRLATLAFRPAPTT